VISELPMQAPQPFFSADSQWLAFFDAGKLKKMPVEGGSPVTLAEAPTPRGGTWISDGSIVFTPVSRGGLMWLPASGGPPQPLTLPDEKRGETSHRQPTFLPQTRTVLFVTEYSAPDERSLQAVSLDTKEIRSVSPGGAVTSLGRGGSDLTAVLLAAAIRADACELIKDVPGYFTADPHRDAAAQPIHDLGIDEALRMADGGCDLVQRAALAAAAHADLHLVIRSMDAAAPVSHVHSRSSHGVRHQDHSRRAAV